MDLFAKSENTVKKTTSPMFTFVSALGPGSGLRALSLPPFGPLTSVGLKELFYKTTVLLAFASAKRIEHLHTLFCGQRLQCHSPAEIGIRA